MENKQPTEEQLRELWEWCGFSFVWQEHTGEGYEIWGLEPGKRYTNGRRHIILDLNNLFRFAVPKLREDGYNAVDILLNWALKCTHKEYEGQEASLLFWAIWDVIHQPSSLPQPSQDKGAGKTLIQFQIEH